MYTKEMDVHSSLSLSLSLDSRHGMASMSRQMTIFYGGQAHVFDDVHPNKVHLFFFTSCLDFFDIQCLCYHLSL